MHLPTSGMTDFRDMVLTPDTLIVDKTEYVLPSRTHGYAPYHAILLRRPSGFGKTTFLSTLAARADQLGLPHKFFPTAETAPFSYDPTSGLVVILLDFADLLHQPPESRDDVVAACLALLRKVADDLMLKYFWSCTDTELADRYLDGLESLMDLGVR